MWLNLNDGFLSIVAHLHKPDHLLVRARKREHLESVFPNATVYVLPDADYPYRADVLRSDVANRLLDECETIQYSNFKGSILDDEYHNVLMQIWGLLWAYGLKHRPKQGVSA